MVDTHRVQLYLSGPIEVAKQTIRKFCLNYGLCVTIDSTTFIYTGGEESGYVVGLLNYPRFPSRPTVLEETAEELAQEILEDTFQHSVLIVTPTKTKWITKKEQ